MQFHTLTLLMSVHNQDLLTQPVDPQTCKHKVTFRRLYKRINLISLVSLLTNTSYHFCNINDRTHVHYLGFEVISHQVKVSKRRMQA